MKITNCQVHLSPSIAISLPILPKLRHGCIFLISFSCHIRRNVDATIIAGSAYCTAPECLRKLAPYSPAADIFAFGLLVCELIVRLVNNGSTIPRTAVGFSPKCLYSFHLISLFDWLTQTVLRLLCYRSLDLTKTIYRYLQTAHRGFLTWQWTVVKSTIWNVLLWRKLSTE